MSKIVALITLLLSGLASAHQFTPAYPRLTPHYFDGVLQTEMKLFNRRPEVEYYELSVYDENWNKVPFASESRVINIKHLETKNISIFIREKDAQRATYVCTRSLLKREDKTATGVSTRICSKLK